MPNKFLKWLQDSNELERAIIISIIAGVVIAATLIIEKKDESFSSLYIYPESYSNYPMNSTTSFTYGVKSFEKERTSYNLEIFVGNQLVDQKLFDVNPGEAYEETETLQISKTKFPEKVYLVLKSPFNTYFVHYWLLNPQEAPPPAKVPEQKTPSVAPVKTPFPAVTPASGTPAYTPASGTPAYTPALAAIALDSRRGFQPKNISIKAGDSVRFNNRDTNERSFTLVSEDGLFNKYINEAKGFEYKFNTSGTYRFYLKEFPDMKGVVTVK